MNIGFDFDGVIADSHSMKPVIAKQMFGVSIPPDMYKRDLVLNHGLLTPQEYDVVSKKLYSGDVEIQEVYQAILYIKILMTHGHAIKVVTSRSGADGALQVALEWFAKKNLYLDVIGVGYGKHKTDACRGLDVFVDDDLQKLLPLQGLVKHLLLFSSPTNRQDEAPTGVHRLDSWWEIYNYIRQGGL